MASRTVGEVQDTLDRALGWRRVELLALVTAMTTAESKSGQSPLARALARSCMTMIYAHWEGFVKEACQCYVDFIARRRLRFRELNDGLLRAALLNLAKRAALDEDSGTAELLDVVRRPNEARARIPKTSMVDTKSNLRYIVLLEILRNAGFPTEKFETKSKFIDSSLCDVRNTVAHGRELFPRPDEVATAHREVLEMMEALRDLIMATVREESYRAV